MRQLKIWQSTKSRPNVQQQRQRHLRKTYGLTVGEYDDLLASQGGKCAVCHGENTTYGQHRTESLCVDHDHATGKVRGLLCHKCNRSIGNMGDNPELLRKMAEYLEAAR